MRSALIVLITRRREWTPGCYSWISFNTNLSPRLLTGWDDRFMVCLSWMEIFGFITKGFEVAFLIKT